MSYDLKQSGEPPVGRTYMALSRRTATYIASIACIGTATTARRSRLVCPRWGEKWHRHEDAGFSDLTTSNEGANCKRPDKW